MNDPEESVLVNSQHLDLAERIVGKAIRPIFANNKLFRICYPEWCPPENLAKNWGTESKLTIPNRIADRKEPSVMAGSFSAPKTGDHFGVILNDDPHNEQNITTMDQIQKVKEGWKAQGPLGDGKRTRRIYVATRWHFADVNDEIMQKRAPLFYKKFTDKELRHNQPLLDIEIKDKCAVFLMDVWANPEHTDVIWPEKEPVENIKDYRDQWGSYFFSCQMENDPVPPEDRTFNPEDFRYYDMINELDGKGRAQKYFICGEESIGTDPDTNRPIMRYRKIPCNEVTNYMTVDPAYGDGPQNDYNGIVVCGHWVEPNTRMRWLIVLDVIRQRLTTAQSKRKIEELYVKWDCKAVGIEANALQKTYVEELQRDARWGSQFKIRVVPIKRGSGASKGMRVTRLEPYYETHRIWHPKRMQGGALEQELLSFVGAMSRGASDDVADAMSDHVDFAHVRKNPDFDPLAGAKEEKRNRRDSDPWGKRKERDLWRVI